MTLILENHYKDGYWNYPEFAQDSETFLEVLDRLGDMPHFGVNYDPSNALIAGEDPIALLEAVKHRVVTMHASDRMLEGGTLADLHRLEAEPGAGYADILKHGVIGEGLNDYDRIFLFWQTWVSTAGYPSKTATIPCKGWNACTGPSRLCAERCWSTGWGEDQVKQDLGLICTSGRHYEGC